MIIKVDFVSIKAGLSPEIPAILREYATTL